MFPGDLIRGRPREELFAGAAAVFDVQGVINYISGLIDYYGHHPAEIRLRWNARGLQFQPHSRALPAAIATAERNISVTFLQRVNQPTFGFADGHLCGRAEPPIPGITGTALAMILSSWPRAIVLP